MSSSTGAGVWRKAPKAFPDSSSVLDKFQSGISRIKSQKRSMTPSKSVKSFFKVPEGHHPRGTTLREALRGNLPLRGLCGGLSEGSAGSLRGFCGVLRGSAGFSEVFGGSDPMLVTLRNCWIIRMNWMSKFRNFAFGKEERHIRHRHLLYIVCIPLTARAFLRLFCLLRISLLAPAFNSFVGSNNSKSLVDHQGEPCFQNGQQRPSLSLHAFFEVPFLLSGPLRLRVQSRSRTRLRIAASIAFLPTL